MPIRASARKSLPECPWACGPPMGMKNTFSRALQYKFLLPGDVFRQSERSESNGHASIFQTDPLPNGSQITTPSPSVMLSGLPLHFPRQVLIEREIQSW